MRRVTVCLALCLAFAGCAGDSADGTRSFDNNDGELVVANGALLTCSCAFVMNMPDDYCIAWTRASPSVARVGIDRERKTVESSAFITWAARAHWVDEKRGCVLE